MPPVRARIPVAEPGCVDLVGGLTETAAVAATVRPTPAVRNSVPTGWCRADRSGRQPSWRTRSTRVRRSGATTSGAGSTGKSELVVTPDSTRPNR